MEPIPAAVLRWLPGPTLTLEHRAEAIHAVADDLRRLAGRDRLTRPETWVRVAESLGIAVDPYIGNGESAGRLSFSDREDLWIISYNVARRRIAQAATLVHELAHWYWREAPTEWLCGEPVVYYYEGPVEDERHRQALDVERLIVPRWERMHPVGLFEDLV